MDSYVIIIRPKGNQPIPPGKYSITASYFKDGKLDLYNEERLTVSQGRVRFDLVLIPAELARFTPKEDIIAETNQTNATQAGTTARPSASPAPDQNNRLVLMIITGIVFAIIFIIVVIVGYFIYKKINKKKEVTNEQSVIDGTKKELNEEEDYELDEESKKLIEILKTNGGRMLQKQLRDITKSSESSMSLILAELESRGYIKRFKRGRENLVKLIKEEKNS